MSKSKFFAITLISIFSILFTTQKTFSQVNLDSLWGVWNDSTQVDSIRLNAIDKISWDGYLYSQPDSAFYFAQLEYDFAKKRVLKKWMVKALNLQGASFYIKGDYSNAINYYSRSLTLSEKIGNKPGIGYSLINIGLIYKDQANYDKAIVNFNRSLSIFEEIGNKKGIGASLNSIGTLYKLQGDKTRALVYFSNCLPLYEEIGSKKGLAATLEAIGEIYQAQGKYNRALNNYTRSLKYFEEINDRRGIAYSLVNTASVFEVQGDSAYSAGNVQLSSYKYGKVIEYNKRSLVINEGIGDKKGNAIFLNNIGRIYFKLGNNNKAIVYCSRSLNIAQKIGAVEMIKDASSTLYKVYKSAKRNDLALEMFELHITTRDSITNEKNQREVIRQEYKYEYEKQKSEEDKIKLEEEKNKEIKNTRNYIIIFSSTGLLIILLIAAVFYVRSLGKKNRIINNQKEKLKKAKEKAEEANKAKSTFLSNMSHELRTPLNAILGFAQLMRRDLTIGKEQQERINIISRSGSHLLTLINDLLDIAKIESGRETLNISSFDLSVFLDEISDLFQSRIIEKGLFYTLEKKDDLPRYIKSDEAKLRQVLINLLGNALKFTEAGGVTLRVRSTVVAKNIQALHFEVEDTGIGIGADQVVNIFEPFVQVQGSKAGIKGTGLGLSICKSFMELLGGEISVESKLGEGTVFRVDLEVASVEAAEAGGIELARPAVLGLEPGQSAWRILVVEDNAENRLLLNSLLIQVGFDTRLAENGEEAVNLFKQWQPHFIWMDMRMPVMDGYQATAKIRSLPGGDTVKIVAITASTFREQRNSIMEAGCDEVMHKPYQHHEIFETMREQLGVRYIYEEKIDKSPSSAKKVIDIELAKEMADSLPKQLFDELKQSSMALDMEETYKVLERIAEVQPELAELLRMRVEELDFSAIKNILNHE